MPAETKYKIIVRPVNKEPKCKSHAGISRSQIKNIMRNPTYMLCLG